MATITFCYKTDVPFNEEYYRNKHLTWCNEVLKPLGMQRYQVTKFLQAMDGSKPPYQLTTTLYFESRAALQSVLQSEVSQEGLKDLVNFYEGVPEIFLGEVVYQ
ncbi:EthD family reductase [Metabacillus sp. RGM 3146]|uniref:EthD family reductase n=1 Tax=Metabacillus sp. RGM 3146 TaxID=3401092 RepID=UPI003B99C484